MAEFLAYRIVSGKLAIDKVPLILRDEVKQSLIELGYIEPTESEV